MEFYEFPIPAKLDGLQLKAELGCDEVYIREDKLVIGGTLTRAQAEAGIAAHVPVTPKEPTVLEKLDSIGLSINDLKAALGL
jgi:hypothetical protein